MQPLIDADVLLHEIGWSGEFTNDEGEVVILDDDHVAGLLHNKIKEILLDVEATEPPILFVTDSPSVRKVTNRLSDNPKEATKGFRYDVAVTQPYKGNRKNPKPYHFYNLLTMMLTEYEVLVSEDGYEADDELVMYQLAHDDTIICSRDKDLRICPGMHYTWECGKQRSEGPLEVDQIGFLQLREKIIYDELGRKKKVDKKIFGGGLKFFYFQMLAGDTADHIPGLPGLGTVKAYNLLNELNTEWELFSKVKSLYKENPKVDNPKDYFLEQAKLLWMVRERGVGYSFPKKPCDKTPQKEV